MSNSIFNVLLLMVFPLLLVLAPDFSMVVILAACLALPTAFGLSIIVGGVVATVGAGGLAVSAVLVAVLIGQVAHLRDKPASQVSPSPAKESSGETELG